MLITMIIKSKQFTKFAVVSNEIARDKKLSMKAKGLFLILASLPEDWAIYKTQLCDFSCDGRTAAIKAFNELIKAGLIIAVKKIKKSGQFDGWEYIVYPERQLPITENLKSDKPITENLPLTNTNSTNKEKTNKEYKTHTPVGDFLKILETDNNNDCTEKKKVSGVRHPSRDNGKPKYTDTIDKRKKRFWEAICAASYKEGVSTNQESADKFYEYWTEENLNGIMRFEEIEFWNTGARLNRWNRTEKFEEY